MGMRTEKECANYMIERYGNDASIHATYNLMLYDRKTRGYDYWYSVLSFIRLILR